MTPAARYAAAMGVLDAWRGGKAVEIALSTWARGARYAGSKDRAAVRDHVFDALRCFGSASALGGGESGRQLILGLVRLRGTDPASVFTGEGHAPAPLTHAEATPTGAKAGPDLDLPAWTHPFFEARFGTDAKALYAEFQHRAPVYLRVNAKKSSLPQAISTLAEDGITAEPVAACATALTLTDGARKLRLSSAYQAGLVELQDLSVQLAVSRIAWPDKGRILDFCAGGGGKSLAITAQSTAEIHAHDAYPNRMADLPERARRAGAHIRQVSLGKAKTLAPYGAVLCDVPCSGSGTWRRDPEAKWRLTPESLEALTTLQAEILDQAAELVAPDGRLVYMTCSLFAAENEDQIARFCATHPGWRSETMAIDSPLSASDGFFTAILSKKRQDQG